MANASNKAFVFLSFALVISLLFVIAMAETRSIFPGDLFQPTSTLRCESVVGVETGDTCFDIANSFNLSATAFDAINPNLNCTALFVGQWLCIDGSK